MTIRHAMTPIQRIQSLFQYILVYACISLVASNVSAQSANSELDALEELLAIAGESMQEYIDKADKSSFDAAALQSKLGSNPDDLADWIQSNITWVRYDGALKGADASIMSGKANLLDQTLLFERLMHFAGYETKIHAIKLNPEQRTLLRDSYESISATVSSSKADATLSQLSADNIFHALTAERNRSIAELNKTTESQFKHLNAVFTNTTNNEQSTSQNSQSPDLTHLYWVSYSRNSSEWTHTSVRDIALELNELANAATAFDYNTVPQELQHSVELSLSIEVQEANNPVVRTEELFQKSIPLYQSLSNTATISFIANKDADIHQSIAQMNKVQPDPASLLTASDGWVPLLNFGKADTASRGFDIHGNTYSTDNLEKLGEISSISVGSAASTLSTLNNSTDQTGSSSTLVGVVLSWTSIRPNSDPQTFTRNLLTAADTSNAETWRRKVSALLHGRYSFLLQHAVINDAYINYRIANNFINAQFVFKYLFEKLRSGSDDYLKNVARMLSRRNDSSDVNLLDFANLRFRHDNNSYLQTVNIIADRDYAYPAESNTNTLVRGVLFDIIANESTNHSDNPKSAIFKAGIWDTALETRQFDDKYEEIVNATQHYATLSNNEYQLITAESELHATEYSEAEQTLILEELQAGNWIAIADNVSDRRSEQGHLIWWRYTPSTECILGQAATAFGVAGTSLSEYIVQIKVRIIPWTEFLQDMAGCGVESFAATGSLTGAGICMMCNLVKHAISHGAGQGIALLRRTEAIQELFRFAVCEIVG